MIYDYICPKCEHEQEVIHGMNEQPEVLCELCNEKMVKIITGGSGFILKGSGWFGKNDKEKREKMKKRSEIGKKMVKNHDIPQILPNYMGEVCKSWDDAKKLAKQNGADGIRYESQVKQFEAQQAKTKEKISKIAKGEE